MGKTSFKKDGPLTAQLFRAFASGASIQEGTGLRFDALIEGLALREEKPYPGGR
jgi:hypothetical protein